MKAILKAGALLTMVLIMVSSCSVERKTREGKKNVIDVGMNQNEVQHQQVVAMAGR